MNYSLWDHKSLLCSQVDASIFKIDDEMPLQHEEELVVVVVFVPVVLPLHYAESNHGIVDFTQGLVVPAVLANADQCRDIHQTQRGKLDAKMRCIRIGLFGR